MTTDVEVVITTNKMGQAEPKLGLWVGGWIVGLNGNITISDPRLGWAGTELELGNWHLG